MAMEISTGSGSGSALSSESNNHQSRQLCKCGLPAKIFKSKTRKNPNRMFYGCELYKEGGTSHCKFFRWLEGEDVNRRLKGGVISSEDEIREKERSIAKLTSTIIELRRQIVIIDSEVKEKKKAELELKTKVEDLEKLVCRQHIIITGLSGLFVCAIGVVFFG